MILKSSFFLFPSKLFSDFSSLDFYFVWGRTSAKGSTSLSYFGKAGADGTIGGGI